MTRRLEVKVGQVWADKDKRESGREVTVVGFTVKTDPWGRKYDAARIRSMGRETVVRLDRLRSKFQLVQDATT